MLWSCSRACSGLALGLLRFVGLACVLTFKNRRAPRDNLHPDLPNFRFLLRKRGKKNKRFQFEPSHAGAGNEQKIKHKMIKNRIQTLQLPTLLCRGAPCPPRRRPELSYRKKCVFLQKSPQKSNKRSRKTPPKKTDGFFMLAEQAPSKA